MTYLLDTHFMIWAIADTGRLSKTIKGIITDPENQVLISTVSFWEVSLKSSLGKMEISGFGPEDLPWACLQAGFEIERLSAKDSSTFHKLTATYHKDPFDRMIIWQAMCNGYTLISADSDVKKYASVGLKIIY